MSDDHFTRHYARGYDLLENGRSELALREFAQALRIRPDDAWTLAKIARCRSELREHGQAVDAARQALALDPADDFVQATMGYVCQRAGRSKEALPFAMEALRRQPRDVAVLHLLSCIHSELGDRETALRRVDEAIAVEPTDAVLHASRACYLRICGRLDEARAAAETALSLDPDSFWSHLELARTAETTRDWHTATGAFREALRLSPDSTECREAMVRMLRTRNPVFHAVLTAERWLGAQPVNIRWVLVGSAWYAVCAACGFSPSAIGFAAVATAAIVVARQLCDGGVAAPFADTVLRFDRYGRQLLKPSQIVASDRLSILILCVAGVGAAASFQLPPCGWVAAPLGAMALLSASWITNCRPGRRRAVLVVYLLAVAIVGMLAFGFVREASTQIGVLSALGPMALGAALAVVAATGFVCGPSVAQKLGYPWSHRFD
ncbi:MAG: tetratricopeptide repeat protein [Planctomycetes bacterium]|nr:tetratricopeptide repeat protein [Planctomycetota bacterium]